MGFSAKENAKANAIDRAHRDYMWSQRHPEIAHEQRQLRKQRAEMRKKFAHKRHGTPETHQKASRVVQGALARLYQTGAIDADQLANAVEIGRVHAQITADTSLKTISLETRVDVSRSHDGTFYERLSAVRAEIAYGRWRNRIGRVSLVLAMIVDDVGLVEAARKHGIHYRTARRQLIEALDLWGEMIGAVVKEVDAADLAAMQAGLC